MTMLVHLVGGGAIEMVVDSGSLADIGEQLRLQRGIHGRAMSDDRWTEVFVPAHRVQLIMAE